MSQSVSSLPKANAICATYGCGMPATKKVQIGRSGFRNLCSKCLVHRLETLKRVHKRRKK